MNPLISVVIPTFNREKVLKRAIDSVVSQTYDNWEIIAINLRILFFCLLGFQKCLCGKIFFPLFIFSNPTCKNSFFGEILILLVFFVGLKRI